MPEERHVKAVEISVFAHATEDEDRVKQAVKRVAPHEQGFDSQRLTGHYDDPITLLTARITRAKEATDLLAALVNGLSSIDRQTLFDELPNHVDEKGNLYIRLDKQKAFNGRATLQENDPIRIKARFRLPHGADPVVTIREYLLNAGEEQP